MNLTKNSKILIEIDSAPYKNEVWKCEEDYERIVNISNGINNIIGVNTVSPNKTFSLNYVARVADKNTGKMTNRTVVGIGGGNNGTPDWNGYFGDILNLMDYYKSLGYLVTVLKIDNDIPDDTYNCVLVLQK